MYNIKQGDCLELMKEIPSGSVDFILTELKLKNSWTLLNESLRYFQRGTPLHCGRRLRNFSRCEKIFAFVLVVFWRLQRLYISIEVRQ